MCHLIGHVLTEAQAFGPDADTVQEALRPCHEVGERLVVDDSLSDSVASGHLVDTILAVLVGLREERQHRIGLGGEVGMLFTVLVDEMLDLS